MMCLSSDNVLQDNLKENSDLPSSNPCGKLEQDQSAKCAIIEISKEDQLIKESLCSPFVNSTSENNTNKSCLPIHNNGKDCPDLEATVSDLNPGQDKSSIENCTTSLTLDMQNNFDEVKESSSLLSESLKSFNLAASLREEALGRVAFRQQKSKIIPRYTLESINESLENKCTPCVTPKSSTKPVFEGKLTPRRSARLLEKLNSSSSYESILNVEKPKVMNSLDLGKQLKTTTPKIIVNGTPRSSKKKSQVDKDFTPRRSQRISEMMRRSSSYESLFDVKRPSVMDSPCSDDNLLEDVSGISYDFDNLELEESPIIKKSGRAAKMSKKVSLLYSPSSRKSVQIQSVKTDLMSFSPS